MRGCLTLGFLLALVVGAVAVLSEPRKETAAPARPVSPAERAKHAERAAHLERLIAEGVFEKIERREQATDVFVGPAWGLANAEQRAAFVRVVGVHDAIADPRVDLVVVKSAAGRRLAVAHAATGWSLDSD